MPLGAQLAQVTHAAGESARLAPDLPPDTHAVVLHARDEVELLKLEARRARAGIPARSIREPDAPYNNQLMAIGISPMDRNRLRKLLSSLPLAR